jgi:hypothetical protein
MDIGGFSQISRYSRCYEWHFHNSLDEEVQSRAVPDVRLADQWVSLIPTAVADL